MQAFWKIHIMYIQIKDRPQRLEGALCCQAVLGSDSCSATHQLRVPGRGIQPKSVSFLKLTNNKFLLMGLLDE